MTVTVRPVANLAINEFYSDAVKTETEDKYQLAAGDADAVLQWSVTPENAEVTVIASTGEQAVSVACAGEEATTTAAMELEDGSEVTTDPLSAKGCATVHPTEETVYTLTAKSGDQTVTKEITIGVVQALSAELTVNGSPDVKVDSYPAQVTLAWKVAPANAAVTITATPPLKADAAKIANITAAEGTVAVQVSENTTFKLTATVEGQEPVTDVSAVTASVLSLDCSQYKAYTDAKGAVFAGEKIKVRWSLPASGLAIAKVRVARDGASVAEALVSAGSVDVTAKSNLTVSFLDANGKDYCQQPVKISLAVLQFINGDKAVRVAKDPMDPKGVYVGTDAGFNGGNVKVTYYNPKGSEIDVPFLATLQGFDSVTKFLNPNFLKNIVKEFPVNAVAVAPKTGRVYVATTGVVVYQTKKGWATLSPLLRTDNNGNYPGIHASCFGKKQPGRKSKKKGEIVTMGQVCDMAVSESGALYVATDRGLLWLADAENYIKNSKAEKVQGKEKGNPLYPSVVNDVEVASLGGKEVIIAAGSKGIYVSENGGKSWDSAGGEEMGEVYSVAVANTDDAEVLVAGTSKGVYVMKAAGGRWSQKEINNAAYSVSVDPYDGKTVYAGTSAGFYVSRDAGATFANASPATDADLVVRSVMPVYSSDPSKNEADFYMYLATESGVMRAYAPETHFVDAPAPAPETTQPEVPAVEEPEVPTVEESSATGNVVTE